MDFSQTGNVSMAAAIIVILAVVALGGISFAFSGHIQF
jgi:hypothetical protein